MHWKNRTEYAAVRCLTGALAALPDRWNARAGKGLGHLAGPVLGIRKNVVRRQLAAVYPEALAPDLDRLTADVYRHLGQSLAEVFGRDPGLLQSEVEVVPGWQELDTAMARGRGVLAVTAHLGNFELGGRILAARYPVLDVVKPMRNPLFESYLQEMRARYGVATVAMDDSGRAVLAHLREGGLVTLLVDQDAGRQGVRTDFLGHPASTWPGAARLALRTGAAVVPVAILRQPDGRHVLHVGRSLEVRGDAARTADVADLTGRITAAVEHYIRQDPAQWFWVHRRWKGAAEADTEHGA